MATPKIVEQQLRDAEALQQAAQAQEGQQPVIVTDVSQLVTPPAAPPPAPAPQPPAPDVWEQKYRSLKGLFDQKVPELQAQSAAQSSQITALTEQVRTMTELMKRQVVEPDKPTKAQNDPRDVEQFGADLVEMVQRYAGQMLSTMDTKFTTFAQQLDGRVAKLEETVTGVREDTAVTRQRQFYAVLGQLVPDFEQINSSEAWLTWLGQTDEVYGVPRQAALDAAFQRLNAEHVAAIFNKFKSGSRPSMESQVSPSSIGGAPQEPSRVQVKQFISQKAVQQFYNDVAKGRYAGKPDEQARLEAEINQAAMEGRIT